MQENKLALKVTNFWICVFVPSLKTNWPDVLLTDIEQAEKESGTCCLSTPLW